MPATMTYTLSVQALDRFGVGQGNDKADRKGLPLLADSVSTRQRREADFGPDGTVSESRLAASPI